MLRTQELPGGALPPRVVIHSFPERLPLPGSVDWPHQFWVHSAPSEAHHRAGLPVSAVLAPREQEDLVTLARRLPSPGRSRGSPCAPACKRGGCSHPRAWGPSEVSLLTAQFAAGGCLLSIWEARPGQDPPSCQSADSLSSAGWRQTHRVRDVMAQCGRTLPPSSISLLSRALFIPVLWVLSCQGSVLSSYCMFSIYFLFPGVCAVRCEV